MNYDELISSEVSTNEVCGINLEDDSGFQNFFFESEGTPERFDGQTTSPAEPPDWRSVKKNALSYLEKTHDLKLISIFAQSVLNTEGIIKFEECLKGLAELISKQWDEVYPPLDEDDGDPMERVSALGHLNDKAFIINILKNLPIVTSKVLGNITYRIINRATDPSTIKNDSDLDVLQVQGGFKDCNSDDLTTLYNAVNLCINHLNTINQTFIEQSGNEYNVNFDDVTEVLTQIEDTIKKFGNIKTTVDESNSETPDENNAASADDETIESQNITSGTPMNKQSFDVHNMTLTSRQEVENCLDLILNYYKDFEPSSPIPILINRSQKLIHLDFLEIVRDIFPEGLEQVNKLSGSTDDSE